MRASIVRNLAVAVLLAGAAAAQEGSKDGPKIPPFLGGQQEQNPQEEMKELFRKVERRLGEIDKLLYDAGSGNAALTSQKESGIDELLRKSKANGQEAISGIDRILEIARAQGGT